MRSILRLRICFELAVKRALTNFSSNGLKITINCNLSGLINMNRKVFFLPLIDIYCYLATRVINFEIFNKFYLIENEHFTIQNQEKKKKKIFQHFLHFQFFITVIILIQVNLKSFHKISKYHFDSQMKSFSLFLALQ